MGPFQKFHADSADPPSESTVSPLEAGIDPHGVNRKVVIGIVAGLIVCILLGIQIVGTIVNPPIPSRYLEVIQEYKSHLKDPSSMRIYGDVVACSFVEDGSTMISVIYDAKNGFGGYTGKSDVLISLMPDADPIFIQEDGSLSDYYMDIRALYDAFSDIEELKKDLPEEVLDGIEEAPFDFAVYDGAAVAKAIGAEYYDA